MKRVRYKLFGESEFSHEGTFIFWKEHRWMALFGSKVAVIERPDGERILIGSNSFKFI